MYIPSVLAGTANLGLLNAVQAMTSKQRCTSAPVEAVIFDMDGVVTNTRNAHVAAWKRTFDEYLQKWAREKGRLFEPFDEHDDYCEYVDGKPRYRGVEDFLRSRGIVAPFGRPDDTADRMTICGIGNRKNDYFRTWLATHRVEVFPSSRALLKILREHEVKFAVYSASQNAEAVLQSAGIAGLFDARIDGLEADRLGLKSKPFPDIIIEALARLKVEAGRSVVIEDAIAGVKAARQAKPLQVIGVNRSDYAAELLANGADIVVNDLGELYFDPLSGLHPKMLCDLVAPWKDWPQLRRRFLGQRLVVFLDYDGTLTPIVDDPNRAVLDDETRQTVRALAQHYTVAVISGRDRSEVERLVGVETLYYAGSHGFDIGGPHGQHDAMEVGIEFVADLDRAERFLRDRLSDTQGVLIDRKRFAISVHYRHTPAADFPAVEEAVNEVTTSDKRLTKSLGKKVFQIQPQLDWNKGRAVSWLLGRLNLENSNVVPIYVGDDITDENAFRVVLESGLGVAVRDGNRPTAANYAVSCTREVRRFLEMLIAWADENTA